LDESIFSINVTFSVKLFNIIKSPNSGISYAYDILLYSIIFDESITGSISYIFQFYTDNGYFEFTEISKNNNCLSLSDNNSPYTFLSLKSL